MIETMYRYLARPSFTADVVKKIVQKAQLGSYLSRVRLHAVERPAYAHCVYQAALLARKLGLNEISVIEFGVAGGAGLLALERHAERVGSALALKIYVYGFDTGSGLPAPVDYRDIPYQWQQGFYSMDEERLQSKLQHAELILGNVAETVENFCAREKVAPVGAIMFDLDFYSSTVDAFRIFNLEDEKILPRVHCYFDDIIGDEQELYCQFTGERLAIAEFNRKNTKSKIAEVHYLRARRVQEYWYDAIRVVHNFSHNKYSQFVGNDNQQLSIEQR